MTVTDQPSMADNYQFDLGGSDAKATPVVDCLRHLSTVSLKFHSHLLVLKLSAAQKTLKSSASKAVVVGIKALRQVEPHRGGTC
ncbi:unnamed protein product [Arabidopsis lyrata]|jgi:hypothetical protein|uniref:Uncharacterized protein n=2 Tax=Arabidopsis TaxID=3701 RepID=A0A8T2GCL3_ARASU|nr:hypothetical protein ISN44_Un239g000110 [Arabidopsis suecica]KAG7528947.1 hypothetical protein ISN45_Un107g000230 [Arabidopsis thaliana x Arabidopsis arenosa]KAG7529220.1 hypothetical protein ISN44_Un144g000190 [Arabidopsis suecica]KAG7640981.1 hypothetical protein ISN44_As02g010340 [Arabidopsis suecica]CAH8269629.1 unnamed protein product [Arabidopsis lyrata]